jgi:hypothetical protein
MSKKETIKSLIDEFYVLESKNTLEEIIQSILDDVGLSNEGKINFIKLKLQMDKANKEIIKLLEDELVKEDPE